MNDKAYHVIFQTKKNLTTLQNWLNLNKLSLNAIDLSGNHVTITLFST